MISDRICRPNIELSRSKQAKRLFVDLIVRMPAAWLLAAALLIPSIAVGEDSRKTLKSGWYPWDPYQYLLVKNDLKRLTGLDVQLVRAVFAQMGYDVDYEEVSWKQHQLDVQNGVRDIAAGAFKNPERTKYAYYSAPYRKETDVLYVRKGEASKYSFKNVVDLTGRFQQQSFRLGAINGFTMGPISCASSTIRLIARALSSCKTTLLISKTF